MIPYVLHAGCILSGCLLFYKLLLQKETFYGINRFVLLGCLALSFILPLFSVPQQWSFRKAVSSVKISSARPVAYSSNTTPQVQQNRLTVKALPPEKEPAVSGFKIIIWIGYLYWFGVVAFGLNLLLQVIALLHRACSNPVIRDGRFRIVEVSGSKAPCSFGNNIFINPEKYDWETYSQILLHEKVHIEQGHSVDILLSELVLIFQWYNPFAWLYRKEVENNLEFLTDARLLERDAVEKESYQLSLLKVSVPHLPLNLTTNYNQSLLKKRIVMMNAKKSNVHTTWKYLFLLPVLVLFMCLLNKPVAISQFIDTSGNKNNDPARSANNDSDLLTEGVWFATIKGDLITMEFRNNGNELSSLSTTSFLISEFSALPNHRQSTFTLTREAGVIRFTGRFEDTQGMGRYRFSPKKDYSTYLSGQGIADVTENDLVICFLRDVKRESIRILKSNGYSAISKNDLVRAVTFKINDADIRFWKQNGYTDVTLHDLVSLKSFGVDSSYLNDIQSVGYTNVPRQELMAMKKLNVTAAFIKSFQNAGYENISVADLIALKSRNVTSEFVKGFSHLGYSHLRLNDIVRLKSTGITPDYVVSMKHQGFNFKNLTEYIRLKNMN